MPKTKRSTKVKTAGRKKHHHYNGYGYPRFAPSYAYSYSNGYYGHPPYGYAPSYLAAPSYAYAAPYTPQYYSAPTLENHFRFDL
jgi:hypothetical protein